MFKILKINSNICMKHTFDINLYKRKRHMTNLAEDTFRAEKNTRGRILDVAEHLFATRGYHLTSLREITSQAGANLAAVNYHFGSKENLLRAVLERRIVPANENRLQQLEAIRSKARAQNELPKSEDVLRAFISPSFDILASGEGGKDFQALISQAHLDPDDTIRRIFYDMVYPIFVAFMNALCEALPDLPRETVSTRFMFIIGARSHMLMNLGRTDHLEQKELHEIDIHAISEELVAFGARGLEEK